MANALIFEHLDIEIPEYPGGDSHLFSGGSPKLYKELADTAEGKTLRTSFFEKNLVGIYWGLGRPVPYAFMTRDGKVRSLDAGCIKFLLNRPIPEVALERNMAGEIVAVEPLDPLTTRYLDIKPTVLKPYESLL